MNIGVFAIALNEVDNIDGWLELIGTDADHIMVADTGSTDGTLEKLAEYPNVTVTKLSIRPWRFDDAWNAALACLPADLEVCVGASVDVRLPADWRQQLERDWPETDKPTALYCWFELGTGGLRWRHPFAHSRHGFRYRFPIHELLVPDPRTDWQRHDSEMVFTHAVETRQSSPDHRERNLAMFAAALQENPGELRLKHYYGRELMYAQRWDEAIRVLTEHAESDAFAEERSESWRYVGDCMIASQPIEEVSLEPYRMAALVSPERREGWVALAELCRLQERWDECLQAARTALAITETNWYFNWPFAWGAQPYDLAALASWNLWLFDDALECGKQALELAPDDERLQANVDWYNQGATVHERAA